MELSQEQQRSQASSLIMELVQCAVNRGAFSSVEQHALQNALAIVTTNPEIPTSEKPEEIPVSKTNINKK